MKPLSFLILLLAFGVNACSPDPSNDGRDQESNLLDTISEPITFVIPEPPKSEAEEIPVKRNEEKSIFKKLGCCANPQKRKTDDCCCTLLLQEWEKMHQSEDSRISGIMKIDPILSDCRKKRPAEFEAVEAEVVDQPF